MKELTDLKKKLKRLDVEIMTKIVPNLIQDLTPRIEDKVIEQLSRGEKGDGSKLPVYSAVSVGVYGKTPGPMTLKDTGDFWKGVTAEAEGDGVSLYGTDEKTEMLEFHYGDDIIDLQERSIEEFDNDDLLDELAEEVEDYLTE